MGKTEKKTYDIIVGIPSYNEADSIAFVVKQTDKGLKKYFPNLQCQIVNVDNNSPDNTKKVFLDTETKTEKKYITTPPGVKGKGNNFLNLFKHAIKVNAKAIVVVDADLKSITPEWIKKFGEPILKGKDFVSPLYIRHKYDATITNNVVFPLVYALFNKFIRQPIGGDFSVSGKLVKYYLKQKWSETTRQFGIDVFMTTNALLGGFSTDQVLLGEKIHKASAPKLGKMSTQVMTTLFDAIINGKDKLSKIKEKKPAKKDYELPDVEPPAVAIDAKKIKSNAKELFKKNKEFLKKIFKNEFYNKLNEKFRNDIIINSKLWADIVFEFLDAYYLGKHKAEIIEAFKAMYWARTYSFIQETKNISSKEAEKLIIEQAKIFYKKRRRLEWLCSKV